MIFLAPLAVLIRESGLGTGFFFTALFLEADFLTAVFLEDFFAVDFFFVTVWLDAFVLRAGAESTFSSLSALQ